MSKKKITKSAVKPEWTLLHEVPNPNVDKLFEIYALDKRKAKVIYHQDTNNYTRTRVVLFEHKNGDFRIVRLSKKFGISITGIIYNRESALEAITYKGGKFYYSSGRKIVQLTYFNMVVFISSYTPYTIYDENNTRISESSVYKYILGRFGWLRNLSEVVCGHGISFNTIIRNKLYNRKSIIRYKYGCSYAVGNMVSEVSKNWNPFQFKKDWGMLKRVCNNLDNLTKEVFISNLFMDTVRMADMLGYRVNCVWSPKRLKVEHDKWTKEVVAVILEFEPLRDLRLNKVFKDFAEYSGYELLLTNHDLIEEGKMMSHCVGTYGSDCDNGTSGIYRVGGHTLELRLHKAHTVGDKEFAKECGNEYILKIGQLRGYSNSSPSMELYDSINEIVLEFNRLGFDVIGRVGNTVESVFGGDDDLPF